MVHARRDMPNILPPSMFAMMMEDSGRIDRWQTAIWTAPGLNITDVGARPVDGRTEQAFIARVLHLLTPESRSSTHYFWAHCRKFRLREPQLTALITEAHRRTFDDKQILELQQRSLEETGATVPKIALRVDEAPLRARRILNTLIKEEAATSHALPKIQRLLADAPAVNFKH